MHERLSPALALLLVTAGGCSEDDGPPSPASPFEERLAVVLEVDRMEGTSPLDLEQTIDGVTVSLADIFAPAGIDIEVRFDQDDIPRREDVTLGLLHGLMIENRATDVPGDALHLYALVVTRDHDEEETLGIMFDFGDQDTNDIPRESFAIFETAHSGLAGSVAREMLLTAAHETAHCFNLHHTDWEGTLFQRGATIEGYSLSDTVRWRLSERSVDHLLHHHRRLVLPGDTSLPFGVVTGAHLARHQDLPVEQFQVVDPEQINAFTPTSPVSRRSAARLARAPYAVATGSPASDGEQDLQLTLSSHKESFQVGEPIDLTVELHNRGGASFEVLPLLDPEHGFLNLAYRKQGDGDWIAFQPVVRRESRGRRPVELGPDDALYGTARIFFGAGGWVFDEPGSYEVMANFPQRAELADGHIQSPPLAIEIEAPTSEQERMALRVLTADSDTGRIGTEQGLYLLFQGGDHLTKGAASMRTLTDAAPRSPQAAAANLALARNALEPTTREGLERSDAERVEEAKRYLERVETWQVSPWALSHAQVALSVKLEEGGEAAEAEAYRESALELQRRIRVKDVDSGEPRRRLEDAIERHKIPHDDARRRPGNDGR